MTTDLDPNPTPRRSVWKRRILAAATVLLAVAHGGLVWVGMDGRAGLSNGWPLWRNDHPLYFHSALATRHFLRQSWTTAGYDPAFMSGYAKSVVFPASSTLPELVVAIFGGDRPERAYKVYVLVSVAAIPWLIALAAWLWRLGPGGVLVTVGFFLLYVWTDFPINYAELGMVPYLLAIPLGLAATGILVRYCEAGGLGAWLASAAAMTAAVLVHLTSAMIVAPAALGVYAATAPGAKKAGASNFTRTRHLGVWLIPVVVLAGNAFWWLPGVWLASTKGDSGFVLVNPEGALLRFRQIVTTEALIERVVLAAAVLGLPVLIGRGRARASGLLAFIAGGLFWGYVAGEFRSLDFLQPGRHTYAFFSGLCLIAGAGVAGGLERLGAWSRARLDAVAAVVLIVVGTLVFGPIVVGSVGSRIGPPLPFLSSRPTPWLLWVVSRVKRHVRAGERLLYEEGGFAVPGEIDPFQSGRFSGLLPDRLGIEVIGGPYLHASLTTNFTQFGEGKLFGRSDWDRDWFVRHARLYRPSAIVCWTRRARAFCRENPDLIEIKEDGDPVLIGRVLGSGGATIMGRAEVEAHPGGLRVSRAESGVDGTVVLRYHSVPCLRTDPPVAWDAVFLEDDPVPFIRLRPPPGAVDIDLKFPTVRAHAPGR